MWSVSNRELTSPKRVKTPIIPQTLITLRYESTPCSDYDGEPARDGISPTPGFCGWETG